MQAKFEVYKSEVTITRVEKVEVGFCPIVRIPIRTQQEADEYMRQGVAIFEKTTKNRHGECRYCFIEVNLYDLAKVARK